MTCRRVQFLIQGYLDGEATVAERQWVEQHVAACRECARELESSKGLLQMLSGAPERRVSPSFECGLMAAVRDVRPAPASSAGWERFRLHFGWRLRVPALVTAGSLAVALVAGLITLQVHEARELQHDRQEYVTTAVERYEQLQQADSKVNWDAVDASIDLNSGSVVTE